MQEKIQQLKSRIQWLSEQRESLHEKWISSKIDERAFQEERNRINGEINGLYFAIELFE